LKQFVANIVDIERKGGAKVSDRKTDKFVFIAK